MCNELFIPLQVLAHWISYQHDLYPFYQIPELAIKAELSRLLYHKINSHKIHNEFSYKKWNCDLKLLADIYLESKESTSKNIVIELKRYNSRFISEDIKKLKKIKCGNIQKYLVITVEKKFPKEFITNNLLAIKKLPDKYKGAKIKRVLKSLSSNKTKFGNYVILLEVT